MAESRAPVLMQTALGGREHVAAILDGTRADQDVPVGLAGLLGKRRRNGNERGAGLRERAVKRWKTQIIADRQAQPAPWQIGRDRALTGFEAVRLAIALAAGEIDIEHVNLVVTRDDLARGIDQERAVGGAIGRDLDRERANMQPDRQRTRELAQPRQAG